MKTPNGLITEIIYNLNKYWYYVVIIILLIIVYSLYNKPAEKVYFEDTKKIEELRSRVDSLNQKNRELQIAYDNKQTTIINNIIKKNEQNAKDISNIPNFDNNKRDSLWAKFGTSKDSIPRGYGNLLQ